VASLPHETAGNAGPALHLLQTRSLGHVVHDELERMILAGELAPGERLGEAALAARLGVSRGPLREAFRALDVAGLVRTEKNRGVFVRDIPIDEAVEIFDLRAAMEELVGRRVAERATAAAVKELREMVSAMDAATRVGDARSYHRLNLAFHDRMVELAANRKLAAAYRRLIRELALFRRRNLDDGATLPQSAAEHRRIVRAVAAGDAAAAGRALYEHVMQSKQRTLAHASAPRRAPQPLPLPRKRA